MPDDQEWLGRWRVPGCDDEVGGQLSITDSEGIQLVLFGSLADWSGYDFTKGVGFPLQEPMQLPIVHGRAIHDLTVLGAETTIPLTPRVTGNEGWSAEAVIEGYVAPTDDGSPPTFAGLRVRLDALAAWSRAPGLNVTYFVHVPRTDVSVRGFELVSGRLSGGATVRIVQVRDEQRDERSMRVATPVDLVVEEISPTGWSALLNDWLQPVQVLLWIAFGETSRVDRIELPVPESYEHPAAWCRIWVPLIDRRRAPNSRLPSGHEALFRATELPGGFASGLDRWLSLWSELRHVLGPLYGRANAPFAYANDRFYSAAAAIEAYYRYCAEDERDLPRQAHRDRVTRLDEVLADHAPDLLPWAVNAARPFNHIRWRQRIIDISETLPDVSVALFGAHLERFAEAAEAARHGHAHALDGGRVFDDGNTLYFAADALTWLLRTCIIIDLGFDIDLVQRRVVQHQRFIHTASALRRHLDAMASE